jgi:hypothetical protein
MTIQAWVKILRRTERNNRYRFHWSDPFALVVPYEKFEKDLTLFERRSRKIVEPAILDYPTRRRWPAMENWQMYFLRERIEQACAAVRPLVAADERFHLLKEVDFSDITRWGLIEHWHKSGLWCWMGGLKERWISRVKYSWMQWLAPIYLESERTLRDQFRIEKLSAKLVAGIRPVGRGLRVFRCILTLKNGTRCWVDFHSDHEPSVSELHRVMVETPHFIRDYDKDCPPVKWDSRNTVGCGDSAE